jgi:hypothetical protein
MFLLFGKKKKVRGLHPELFTPHPAPYSANVLLA